MDEKTFKENQEAYKYYVSKFFDNPEKNFLFDLSDKIHLIIIYYQSKK